MKGSHKKRVLIKTTIVKVQYGSMYLRKFLRNIPIIVAKNKEIFILCVCAIFLRFFRIANFATFLGDQGRDAIIIKRILTLEHLPAIGPPTSIGHIFLGPFYYYFVAPWLLLFNFNPLGLAVGVAFFSCVFICSSYFIFKEFFGARTAAITTALLTFSTTLIDFSRYSWNPNLLPFFSIFSAYFLIKALKRHKMYYFILFGAFLSFSIQLHYLALFLTIPSLILFLMHIYEHRDNFLKTIVGACAAGASFILFSSTLIIFDLRHNFLNSRGFAALIFETRNSGQSNFLSSILLSFGRLNEYIFNYELNRFLSITLLIAIILFILFELRKSTPRRDFSIFLVFAFIGVSLFGGPQYQHYYGAVYIFYFVCIANILSYLPKGIIGNISIGIFLLIYVYLNSQGYIFLTHSGSSQIEKAEKISRIIYQNSKSTKYIVTSLPEGYADQTYRYFLEVWNKRPIDKNNPERGNELFVICEQTCPLVIGNPQWDIANFAPRIITGTWNVEGATIYKLLR